MAASVSLPAAEPLPPRPSAADVAAALAGGYGSGPRTPHATLKAELLHLRAELEAEGSELGGLTFQVGEVVRAWMNVDRDELAADYPDLADTLDELAEHAGVE